MVRGLLCRRDFGVNGVGTTRPGLVNAVAPLGCGRQEGVRMKRSLLARLPEFVGVLCVVFLGTAAHAAPPAPSFLPGQPMLAGNQVILLWVPVAGATRYTIYLNGGKLAEGPANQYMGLGPEAAGEYRYEIAAVDAAGVEGPKSAPGIVRITKLEAPTDLQVRADPDAATISLNWGAPQGAVIYNVFRTQNAAGAYSLVGSVQDPSYRDPELKPGSYYYKISARDILGKESPSSAPVKAVLTEREERESAEPIVMKVQATTELARIDYLGNRKVSQVMCVRVAATTGDLWVLDPLARAIFVVSPSDGALIKTIGPLEQQPWMFDFGPNGDLYVTTVGGSLEVLTAEGDFKARFPLMRPSDSDTSFWEGIPSVTKNYGPSGGAVACAPDEVWVSDQHYGAIEVFDYSGVFRRYIHSYTDKAGKKVRFPAVGELQVLGGGRVLVTFPLAHYAVALDKDLKEVFTIGKRAEGFVGGFIGISGVFVLPDGSLLLTDPGVNSMQMFSGTTGQYLYHLGGLVAEEDPRQPGRPTIDFSGISNAVLTKGDELWLFAGTEGVLMKRSLSKDGPVRVRKEK